MLGNKIRAKRLERGLSIHALAEHAGLTTGFISQVERNLVDPSIASLRKIANTLSTPVFQFLLDESEHLPVIRKTDRKCFTFNHEQIVCELLSPSVKHTLEMIIMRINPGETFCKESIACLGEEILLVMSGCMRIQVGEDHYDLNEGDSIYYFSNPAHKISNTGDTTLVFLAAVTPPFLSMNIKKCMQ